MNPDEAERGEPADEANPYEAPATTQLTGNSPDALHDPTIVKKFREQIHALGAFWIFIGGVAVVASIVGFTSTGGMRNYMGGDFGPGGPPLAVLWGITATLGAGWLLLGVMSCLKQMWAVYAGLVLSYLSLVGQLLSLNLCTLIILVVVILQAHRVISWAGKMRELGVPLTAKP